MIRLLTSLALAALLTAPAGAAQVSQITVTADGQASAMPDMAQTSFTISTSADTAAAATSENNTRYDRLMHALRALGIDESDIRTTSFNVNYNPPPKPPDVPQQGQRYGYSVYRGINVMVHRLALLGKTIDTAVASGVTDVNSVSFDTSQKREQFAAALRDGIVQARTQAQAMAAAAGLRIVRVKDIEEGAPSRVLPMVQAAVFKAAPAPALTEIQPSAVETHATVTVTYEAQ